MGGITKFPWNEWMNGETWTITKGKDFERTLPQMRWLLRNQASRRMSGRVAIVEHDDSLTFTYATTESRLSEDSN